MGVLVGSIFGIHPLTIWGGGLSFRHVHGADLKKCMRSLNVIFTHAAFVGSAVATGKMIPKHVGSYRCGFLGTLCEHILKKKTLSWKTLVSQFALSIVSLQLPKVCVSQFLMAQHAENFVRSSS